MKILNFGSLNVDHVYRVAQIARPGETIPSHEYRCFAGGKGANQSVALARAGACVRHAGKVGPESTWLKWKLADEGVDVDHVQVADTPGGHAIIQVDTAGQNSIVLFGGTNQQVTSDHVDAALADSAPGDVLLLQNEINATADLIVRGKAAGLSVCFNPAPMTSAVSAFALDQVDILIVNEYEGAALAGTQAPRDVLAVLRERLPDTALVLTQGENGATYRDGDVEIHVPACAVDAVDTTGAGDTFIGFFLAGRSEGMPPRAALELGCRAAALCVTHRGAMDSVPTRAEVDG